jgi:hypothetical protein
MAGFSRTRWQHKAVLGGSLALCWAAGLSVFSSKNFRGEVSQQIARLLRGSAHISSSAFLLQFDNDRCMIGRLFLRPRFHVDFAAS